MCFNPRLRTGGDDPRGQGAAWHGCFNPRLRTGGDVPLFTSRRRTRPVSIHASAREATIAKTLITGLAEGFNPRLRTGGDAFWLGSVWHGHCFNPRLRTGGDFPQVAHNIADLRVSIHASAREATPVPLHAHPQHAVSIHASAREATTDGEHPPRVQSSFNPRLRTGGDPHHQGERC